MRRFVLVVLILAAMPLRADDEHSRLPFLGDEARKRGIELPLPFGVGLVYYKLQRDIQINEVRVGRNGATPTPVSNALAFSSTSDVDNLNVKVDMWLLPFLNLYAIVGDIKNKSTTTVALSDLGSVSVPTKLDGSVGGLGFTLAGGVGSFFGALDVNGARADIGFDDRFHALVSSARAGWHGQANARPIRVWASATYWDTFATAKGSATTPDGGALTFEVDQGPKYPWTYGAGFSYSITRRFEFSTDAGADFHGGWYVAIVPVWRF